MTTALAWIGGIFAAIVLLIVAAIGGFYVLTSGGKKWN